MNDFSYSQGLCEEVVWQCYQVIRQFPCPVSSRNISYSSAPFLELKLVSCYGHLLMKSQNLLLDFDVKGFVSHPFPIQSCPHYHTGSGETTWALPILQLSL